MIGGLFGGLLFDPIARYIFTESTEAAISRGGGFACIGLCIGLFAGLIENVSKEACHLSKNILTFQPLIMLLEKDRLMHYIVSLIEFMS